MSGITWIGWRDESGDYHETEYDPPSTGFVSVSEYDALRKRNEKLQFAVEEAARHLAEALDGRRQGDGDIRSTRLTVQEIRDRAVQALLILQAALDKEEQA